MNIRQIDLLSWRSERQNSLLESFLNFLFPQHCVVCGNYIPEGGFPLCNLCLVKIKLLAGSICSFCGRPLDSTQSSICRHCRKKRFSFAFARSVALYDSPLKECVHAFKYRGITTLLPFLGDLMVNYLEWNPFLREVDGVMPVPLHRKRLWERGFNQSFLLARYLGRKFGIPVLGGVERVRPTLPQVGLSPKEREKNLKNAFKVMNPRDLVDKEILIVDDVFTSGATVESLTRTLLKAGSKKVMVLTCATSPLS